MATSKQLYSFAKPYAKLVKTALQMLIGVVIILLLVFHIASAIWPLPIRSNELMLLANQKPLRMVGDALAFSAAIDLAYTLFTPGPDEAVDPVLTGAAAALLIFISKDVLSLRDAGVVLALTATIGMLFLIRDRFIKRRMKCMRLVADEQA